MTQDEDEELLELSYKMTKLLSNPKLTLTEDQIIKLEETLDSIDFFHNQKNYERTMDEMKLLIKKLKGYAR